MNKVRVWKVETTICEIKLPRRQEKDGKKEKGGREKEKQNGTLTSVTLFFFSFITSSPPIKVLTSRIITRKDLFYGASSVDKNEVGRSHENIES